MQITTIFAQSAIQAMTILSFNATCASARSTKNTCNFFMTKRLSVKGTIKIVFGATFAQKRSIFTAKRIFTPIKQKELSFMVLFSPCCERRFKCYLGFKINLKKTKKSHCCTINNNLFFHIACVH